MPVGDRSNGTARGRSLRRLAVAGCLLTLGTAPALAQTPYLVKDINTAPSPGVPLTELTAVGDLVFFRGCDRFHGCELWRTDGTWEGTALVKDLRPGPYDSDPVRLMNFNGKLMFVANDGTHGYELWKSDGTAVGTVLVKDIWPGPTESVPYYFTNANGTLFFSADDGTNGRELWQSDGTAAGTHMVKDIFPGSGGSRPSGLANLEARLFFSADDGANGRELWKSDGTAAGTAMVIDIHPGPEGSSPGLLTNVNGTLFFSAYDDTSGSELWKSDGTAAGTVMVADIRPGPVGSYPGYWTRSLTHVNGTLFFDANDGPHGPELWKSDGTAAGTVMVKDINRGIPPPGAQAAGSYPYGLTNVNGTLFFAADTGYIPARHPDVELWKSDGTEAGTVRVEDIYPGPNSSYPAYFTNVGGTLFFSAEGSTRGRELWKSEGEDWNTVRVKDIYPGPASSDPSGLANANGTLLFSANDGVNGFALWSSDGTDVETAMVRDIDPTVRTQGSSPSELTDVNGTLFFIAHDGTNPYGLWKSDATEAGTERINPGPVRGYKSRPTNVSGTLFFDRNDEEHGDELWRSDGTVSGTALVKDISPGPGGSGPSNLTSVSGTLFFTANDYAGGRHGYELWKSNGTAAGTVMVKDINPGAESSLDAFTASLTNVNGTLFFVADDRTHGSELWKSDGTATGTVLVKDIEIEPPGYWTGSFPLSLTNVNGTLFFTADDGANGYELWKSDGTTDGTVMVKDINPGGASSGPAWLTNVNGILFFYADDGTNGRELWKSDGTAGGTVIVKDINPGPAGSAPSTPFDEPPAITNMQGTLFFVASDGTHGFELWKSDGTAAGTVMVKDVKPGEAGSDPRWLTSANGMLFFNADDGANGYELWQSDGSEAGTMLLADINPIGNSYPRHLTVAGSALFFSAGDAYLGGELWALRVPPTDVAITADDGLAIVIPGQMLTYTIAATNPGPARIGSARVTNTFPAALRGAQWTCTASGGASCTASGSGGISDVVSLPAGSRVTYTATGTVSLAATGMLSNTANIAVPSDVNDPDLSNNSATDVDVMGGPAAALGFFTLTPCRLVDTRDTGAPIGGPILAAQQTRLFNVADLCGIPSTARAVALNITVTEATSAGHVRLFPAGGSVPAISTVSYGAGQTRASNAVVPLNAYGQLSAFVAQATGTAVHVIIDVSGYFE